MSGAFQIDLTLSDEEVKALKAMSLYPGDYNSANEEYRLAVEAMEKVRDEVVRAYSCKFGPPEKRT